MEKTRPIAGPGTAGTWWWWILLRHAMRWTSWTHQKRLGSFMDSRLWRLLLGPGRGIGRLVTGAMGLAMKALSTIMGSQLLSDIASFVQSLDATFRRFPRKKADRTYALLKKTGVPSFVVVSAAEPDALREASFLSSTGLSQENMPLAGLILKPHSSAVVRIAGGKRAIDGNRVR